MIGASLDPSCVLPHGAGMRLLDGPGSLADGWLTFRVRNQVGMSVFDADGAAPPELGLEIMAQACGMVLAARDAKESQRRRRGVVGAVRGYEYGMDGLSVSQRLLVRVKDVLVDEDVVVCEAELLGDDGERRLQQARITLILMEDVA